MGTKSGRGFLYLLILFFLCAAPCHGDALFIHDYKIREYLVGEKEAELAIAYTDEGMFIDKNTRYTGTWMKRFFGKVEENRETTHFLLKKNQICEIDWYGDKIIVFPFAKLSHVTLIKKPKKETEELEEFLKARYRVSEPRFSINSFPEKEKINHYLCQRAEASLRLETRDVKKNAMSVTLVNQKVWVSDEVPGFDEYDDFHKKLGKRTGLDAQRLGSLSFLLRYWKGSLDPIRESLKDIRGYPVKSILTVEGQYTKDTDKDSPTTHSFEIKEELMQLREVLLNKSDKSRFEAPADFRVVNATP
ncbi:Uncharacterized protein dnm_063070 [Desulfonema magnum]|uniref:DUF4412 domain-containing protein n=1 Tax=Desulfonema magnum TaxID=45655 RepID=A0A975BRH5_9BACT|nr:Uncharacterized protein dnm_063070 [Desulfonema magnum]